MLCPLLPTF